MDVVLLHNSKAGDASRSSEDLAALLRRHGYRPECFSLKDALKHMDPLERGEFIVVAGGDGSVKRVATALANRSRPIAPLPIGTANNIARSLGVEGDLDAVVAGWRQGSRRRLDLGLARGPWGERRFIEGVGIGLIGRAIATIDMIDDVSPHKFSAKEDKLYHDLSLLLALAHDIPPVRIEVTQNGEDRSGDYLLLEVLNISRAGPGFELARHADPSDGQLDVVSVRADERTKLQDSLKRCLAQLDHGTTLDAKRAGTLRLVLSAGELRIDDDIVWPPEGGRNDRADGEEHVVVEISVEPGAVEFVLPPPRHS
jgi:diacylglycerol kinase (ATP)